MKRLGEVLSSGFFNEGAQVKEFGEKLSEFFGNHPHVLPLNSCTSSISLALRLAGVGHQDEVITTAMTCVATNMPIRTAGAIPVWADINSATGNICPESVSSRVTTKTKAVVCVNWAGMPCDLDALQNICKVNGLKLIQDAAHSFGALYKDKEVCHFADFTCYSFQAIKHITCGDGGALVCKNEKDFERAKELKWFGINRETSKDAGGQWKGQRWNFDIAEEGYKFHMNNIAAAIGLSQAKHFGRIVSSHRKNAKMYSEKLQERSIEHITPLTAEPSSSPSYWVYSFLLSEKMATHRADFIEALKEFEIDAATVHVPNHTYSCFKPYMKPLPETEYFGKHQLSLPCGWWMKEEDINFVINKVESTLSEIT